MARERNIGLASILALVGLFTLAEARAQQPLLTEQFTAAKGLNQLDSDSQPKPSPEWPGSPTIAPDGTPNVEIGKENPKPARTLTEPARPRSATLASALDLPSLAKLTLLDKAYLDAFSILREDNQCSRFYGGPRAIEALNQLKLQLKRGYFDRSVALRMQGKTSFTTNDGSGLSYRVFDKAELNINGPFYKPNLYLPAAFVPAIGEFSPNTREARVTILLHELGHMIRTSSNSYLLPDDGANSSISEQNTMRVIAVCRQQIKAQSRISFGQALASAQ